MCHYITATLPDSVNLDLVAPIFESHKLGFELIANRRITEQIKPKASYILTTRGQCDCGTVLGSLNHSDNSEGVSFEHELNKFRERGWREAKIQRWIERKERTKERHLREDEARAKADHRSADQWIGFISDLLKSGYTSRIGLLLHWYHGSVESEQIQIQGKEKVKLAELSPEQLMRMKEDVLYEFVAQ